MRKFPLLVITVVLLPSAASPVHGMVCGIAGPWNCFEPQATPLPHEQEQGESRRQRPRSKFRCCLSKSREGSRRHHSRNLLLRVRY
jgi:hypothetical protein